MIACHRRSIYNATRFRTVHIYIPPTIRREHQSSTTQCIAQLPQNSLEAAATRGEPYVQQEEQSRRRIVASSRLFNNGVPDPLGKTILAKTYTPTSAAVPLAQRNISSRCLHTRANATARKQVVVLVRGNVEHKRHGTKPPGASESCASSTFLSTGANVEST